MTSCLFGNRTRPRSRCTRIVNDEVLDNLDKIKVYPIEIKTEQDLAREIARIANQELVLGYKLEDEGRMLTREEAYQQLSHSASLFKAVLEYVGAQVK
jgi:hypothetical protein